MLGPSSSSSALSVPPLHTLVPTRTTLEMGGGNLPGWAVLVPSVSPTLLPCWTMGMRHIGSVVGLAGSWWAAQQCKQAIDVCDIHIRIYTIHIYIHMYV